MQSTQYAIRSTHLVVVAAAMQLLLAGLTPERAAAAWSHDPNIGNLPVCAVAGFQTRPVICSDGLGGAIFAWADSRSGAGGDIYVQRVNAAGTLLWTVNGAGLCTASGDQSSPAILSDDAGGAIVVWQDLRSGAAYDVYAQRVNAAGVAQWTANGIPVCTSTGAQTEPRMVSDGAGGAILAWSDQRAGNADVYAQRISAAGVVQWTANGVALCTAAQQQTQVAIAPDGTGGAIVTWQDFRSGANSDIYAQRINAGAAQWAANGVPVCVATGDQAFGVVISDMRGGALVAWQDPRLGAANYDIYIQNLSGSGAPLWTVDGIAMSTETGTQVEPYLCSDGAGGAWVAWSTARATTGSDVAAGRITAGGTRLSGSSGVTLTSAPNSQVVRTALADGAGGLYVAFEDLRAGVNLDLYAQHLSANGDLFGVPFTPYNGLAISAAAGRQSAPQMVGDGRGGVIAVWADGRNEVVDDIYAQRFDVNGTLGDASPVIVSVRDVPNDQGGKVKLTWNASFVDLERVFTAVEYRIWRSVPPQALAAGALALRRGVTRDSRVAASTGNLLVTTTSAGADYAWEAVEYASAAGLTNYSRVVDTPSDSMAGSNPRTTFMVELDRYGYNPTLHWYSEPDSGYSVDNLRPATPAPFLGTYAAGTARLRWLPNHEADIAGYRVYRGVSPDFTPGPETLFASLSDTGYVDHAGAPYVYRVVAVDRHGNESLPATFVPGGTVDVPEARGGGLAFAPPSPNPARGATQLRFVLPQAGLVRLEVFDASGRHVRTLADGISAAGEHVHPFALTDDSGRELPAGLYLARLAAAGVIRTQRVMVVR